MQQSCPKCNARYAVDSSHIGSRFSCRGCGIGLTVTPQGISTQSGHVPNREESKEPDQRSGFLSRVTVEVIASLIATCILASLGFWCGCGGSGNDDFVDPVAGWEETSDTGKKSEELLKVIVHIDEINAMAEAGDHLWNEGKQSEAVETYLTVIDSPVTTNDVRLWNQEAVRTQHAKWERIGVRSDPSRDKWGHFVKVNLTRTYSRIIDHQTSLLGPDAAVDTIRQALLYRIKLNLQTKEGVAALTAARGGMK